MVKKALSAGAGERARNLRRDMTEAEKRLWQMLRSRQTEGCRFRRQVPIGGFIADALHQSSPSPIRPVTPTRIEPVTPTHTLPHQGGGPEPTTTEDPADPEQHIADLQRQLAECRAGRDEALQRAAGHALPLDGGGSGWG